MAAEPPEHEADDGLDGHDPALPSSKFGREDRVDDGRPEELERVGVGAEAEDADLRVRELCAEEERDGPECEADRDALQEVCRRYEEVSG